MAIYKCKNCLPTNVPDDWTIEKKSEVASLVRKYGKIRAVQLFCPAGMDWGDAKNISFHVTEKKGFCRCKTELIEYEAQCPKCKKLNLDW